MKGEQIIKLCLNINYFFKFGVFSYVLNTLHGANMLSTDKTLNWTVRGIKYAPQTIHDPLYDITNVYAQYDRKQIMLLKLLSMNNQPISHKTLSCKV